MSTLTSLVWVAGSLTGPPRSSFGSNTLVLPGLLVPKRSDSDFSRVSSRPVRRLCLIEPVANWAERLVMLVRVVLTRS
ncbi:hypothetical protein D3C81_2214440 [compost metagenome]